MDPVEPCCLGVVREGQLRGKIVELGLLTTYITGSEQPGGSAVLLIPDVFGFSIPNTRHAREVRWLHILRGKRRHIQLKCRLFADQLAIQGFLVVLPDVFHGNPWTAEKSIATFETWMEINPQGPQVLQLQRLLIDVQQQYRPKSICAIGFCWGGHHSVLLAQTDRISAGVVVHGSTMSMDMVQAIKQPLLILFCQKNSKGTAEVSL